MSESGLSPAMEAAVARLVREGRHAEAARLCEAEGALGEASTLFAAVWEWSEAIASAERAGLFELAYRHAISAGLEADVARLVAKIAESPEEAAHLAPDAERSGRALDAARLFVAAGALEDAARCFALAGAHEEAGACLESSGRYRDAGRAYEAALRSDPEAYAAALSLGRILARMGRYEQATRALQVAARGEHERSDAERWLIACFDALSMREAAAARLEALRRVDPETPPTVEALLLEAFGDVRGLDALRSEEAEASLLAGRYRPTRTLGEGSTGRVLEAEDTLHARSVAIKVLTVGGGMGGRDAHARFAREARIAAALSHPNLVEVYDFVAAGPFLVMELMPGGTLEERLLTAEEAGRTLSVDLARSVANAVLAGLEAVHRRGVIHRDLKPTNVFFGATGDVKLGDFGTAHLRDLGATMTGALQGTLAYMAPEQITAGERPSAATDLYAFGVLLFRMLTGALPLKGPDFVAQHLEREPPRVSTVRPALGRGFDDLVARLLAKDPAARPRSAAEVRAALEAMPWHALDEESEAAARTPEPIVRPVSETPIAPYIDTSRYELRETLPDGAKRVRDCLLERSVLAVPIDAASREHYRACARADGPHLQAVYGFIDDFVLLEDPAGAPCAGEVMQEEGLRAALEALEREGVRHAITAESVRMSGGRAVLLLPLAPPSQAPLPHPA